MTSRKVCGTTKQHMSTVGTAIQMKELDEQGYQTAQECLEFGQNIVQQQHAAWSKSHNNMDNKSLEATNLATKMQFLYIKNMVASLKLEVQNETYETAEEYESKTAEEMDISHETNNSMVLSVNKDEDYIHNAQNLVQPNNIIWTRFQEYVASAHYFLPLQRKEAAAICLMHLLHKTKASLHTYKEIMEWHLIASGEIQRGQPLSEASSYISWEQLFTFLWNRYNMMEGWGKVTKIMLSSSQTWVKIVWNDFCMLWHNICWLTPKLSGMITYGLTTTP
jgi:hypothetical protein